MEFKTQDKTWTNLDNLVQIYDSMIVSINTAASIES